VFVSTVWLVRSDMVGSSSVSIMTLTSGGPGTVGESPNIRGDPESVVRDHARRACTTTGSE